MSSLVGDLPEPDELEVSIFGSGMGECIVIHLGFGEWAVVDSCLERQPRRPIALEYLGALGVDPSAIRFVLVTHWHDDHIAGISEVLRAARNATFFCSAALKKREFLTLVAATGNELGFSREITPGLDEFQGVLEILRARAPEGARLPGVGPVWVSQGHLIHRSRDPQEREVLALSPSPSVVTLSLHELVGNLPQIRTPKRNLVVQDPNALSVVLWIRFGSAKALLGADLIAQNDPLTGWKAVLASGLTGGERAQMFKVPHHGSRGADDEAVWERLLSPAPRAAVTSFTPKRLPSDGQIAKFKARTRYLYCTGSATGIAPRAREKAVEKEAVIAKNRKVAVGPMGHVRLRMKCNAGPDAVHVALRNGAFQA